VSVFRAAPCVSLRAAQGGLKSLIRRRDVLGLLAAAALPWPRSAQASEPLLDESVGFAGQILFLALKTPALVLGVIRNGQTSIQGFGRRADNASEAPGADTVFRIGSITKSFTGQARLWPGWRRTEWSASPIR
jgi:D-alanyl-D-alanine-carboxypeptidase/D-alanyl-D-alanine-endopeptidase